MVQILFTVFGMGYIYENAQIIDNHGTLLHTTVASLKTNKGDVTGIYVVRLAHC